MKVLYLCIQKLHIWVRFLRAGFLPVVIEEFILCSFPHKCLDRGSESWRVTHQFLNALIQKWDRSHLLPELFTCFHKLQGSWEIGEALGYSESSHCLHHWSSDSLYSLNHWAVTPSSQRQPKIPPSHCTEFHVQGLWVMRHSALLVMSNHEYFC